MGEPEEEGAAEDGRAQIDAPPQSLEDEATEEDLFDGCHKHRHKDRRGNRRNDHASDPDPDPRSALADPGAGADADADRGVQREAARGVAGDEAGQRVEQMARAEQTTTLQGARPEATEPGRQRRSEARSRSRVRSTGQSTGQSTGRSTGRFRGHPARVPGVGIADRLARGARLLP